jgi:TonB family protein
MWRSSLLLCCNLALACSSNPIPAGGGSGQGGGGRQLSGLAFDSDGADFTIWVGRFRDEVYRHWVVPRSAVDAQGRVDVEFTVDRDGALTSVRVRSSSGTAELDRAAQSALTSSSLPSLPSDYRQKQVTMLVGFVYN